jgi:hypothetical protein
MVYFRWETRGGEERDAIHAASRFAKFAERHHGDHSACKNCVQSERVLQAQENSSVATVGGCFIEEPGIGDARFGNAIVARIRGIEEICAKLKRVVIGKQPRGFRDAQVYVADSVGTQDVTAHVSRVPRQA